MSAQVSDAVLMVDPEYFALNTQKQTVMMLLEEQLD